MRAEKEAVSTHFQSLKARMNTQRERQVAPLLLLE